ncbi:hypothetical protein KAJ77_07040, partial [bacterium]|nr:hypothetical protein [bacterium]
TLYDTIEVQGDVSIMSLSGNADYTSATVTLLGWPLFAPISNEVIGSDSSAWIYPAAPLGLPVAFHSEPDPADASSLMAVNKQYVYIENANLEHLDELRVLERATMDTVASWAGTTIDPTKAQIVSTVVGAYSATLGDNHWVTGVTVTISTGDHVDYWYTDDLSFGAPFTQYTEPNFFIFNVDPPPDGKATLTFSLPDSSIVIDSVTVPVRADEATLFMHFEVSDPGGLAQGVTISGEVRDVVADALFGPGATVTLNHQDGTVLGTTLTDINSEYSFEYVPSLMPVNLTSSYAGTGYVPWNTIVFNAGATSLEEPGMLAESQFGQIASVLPAFNEPGWNSTLQSYAWFGFETTDPKVPGITFSTDAPGAVVYYWDDSSMMFTTGGTTSSTSNGPQVIVVAPGTSEGIWNFSFSDGGANTGSADAPLITGEFTYWVFW